MTNLFLIFNNTSIMAHSGVTLILKCLTELKYICLNTFSEFPSGSTHSPQLSVAGSQAAGPGLLVSQVPGENSRYSGACDMRHVARRPGPQSVSQWS